MKENKVNSIRNNQSGIASIVIAILIVTILATLITGFTQIIRREQRRTLDRQLSTQAFFAAESGINDARKALSDGYTGQKTCAPLSGGTYPTISGSGSNELEGDSTQYSCLIIDQQPLELEYDPVSTEKSTVIPISNSVNANITRINISWQPFDKAPTGPNFRTSGFANQFTPQGSWNSATGMLRAEVVPTANFKDNDLLNNTRTFFFYPNTSFTNSVSMGDTTGTVQNGRCNVSNTPRWCSVDINGINSRDAYLRLTSIYKASSVVVRAYDVTGTQVRLIGAQSVVDSTGVASEVSRRVQVRIPNFISEVPESVLSSMNTLCKTLTVTVDAGGTPIAVDGAGTNCGI